MITWLIVLGMSAVFCLLCFGFYCLIELLSPKVPRAEFKAIPTPDHSTYTASSKESEAKPHRLWFTQRGSNSNHPIDDCCNDAKSEEYATNNEEVFHASNSSTGDSGKSTKCTFCLHVVETDNMVLERGVRK